MVAQIGAWKSSGPAVTCRVRSNRVCTAKNAARLAITPTTAAVGRGRHERGGRPGLGGRFRAIASTAGKASPPGKCGQRFAKSLQVRPTTLRGHGAEAPPPSGPVARAAAGLAVSADERKKPMSAVRPTRTRTRTTLLVTGLLTAGVLTTGVALPASA